MAANPNTSQNHNTDANFGTTKPSNTSNGAPVSIFTNPSTSSPEQRRKRINAFNNRKGITNKSKKRNKKFDRKQRKPKQESRRINKKDTNNFGFNNEITDTEESEMYNSLLKAVSIHNKLSDNELLKIFQTAISSLNAAWFRHNLHSFFSSKTNTVNGDIITLILRLFTLEYELNNTRHNVPFRCILLDLISPRYARSKTGAHRTAQQIHPLPLITNYHKSNALQIFTQWTTQTTVHTSNYAHIYNNSAVEQKENICPNLDTNSLLFLDVKEMQCLFRVFSLKDTILSHTEQRICDKICELLSRNECVSAMEWTLSFNLSQVIPYNILLLPLLKRQSLLHHALHYIDCIQSQTEMVQNIKHFIVSTISDLTLKRETDIQTSRALKLIERWNFDKHKFEPLIISEIQNFLKWTIHKGHIDDYALLVCGHSIVLQRFVINQCKIHPTTYHSCMKWAKHWNLTEDKQCCVAFKHCKEWLDKHTLFEQKDNAHNIIGFHDLEYCDIDSGQIVFVNTLESLRNAKEVLLSEKVDCIGLDLELMSVRLLIPNMPLECQILQIATFDKCFIFDLQVLETLQGWDEMFCDVFTESKAVKVGMAWEGDLRHLRKQYPDSIAFKSVCAPYLELATMASFMRSDGEFKAKVGECHRIDESQEKRIKYMYQKTRDKEGGLAKIVRWVLRKRLNKYEQLSNWCNRPLRIEQLKYASLDSLVECWLFRKFKEWENETILPDLNGFFVDLYGQTN